MLMLSVRLLVVSCSSLCRFLNFRFFLLQIFKRNFFIFGFHSFIFWLPSMFFSIAALRMGIGYFSSRVFLYWQLQRCFHAFFFVRGVLTVICSRCWVISAMEGVPLLAAAGFLDISDFEASEFSSSVFFVIVGAADERVLRSSGLSFSAEKSKCLPFPCLSFLVALYFAVTS